MTDVFSFDQIKQVVQVSRDILPVIEEGYVLLAQDQVVMPPPAHMRFTTPPGEVHIKYGYIENDAYYVIKIASGFYQNPALGLTVGQGSMLLYNQKTGQLISLLLDQGYLTRLRTGAGGAIAAKWLAPKSVKRIGIVGTGAQARLQLNFLPFVLDQKEVLVWGRNIEKAKSYKEEMEQLGFSITVTSDLRDIPHTCDLIVTTTPAREALLFADDVQPGTHITAVGSDTAGKQELDPRILQKADLVVVDSVEQCANYGELSHALRLKLLDRKKAVPLGAVITGEYGRQNSDQITVTDLTGVAIQDIQITKLTYHLLSQGSVAPQ